MVFTGSHWLSSGKDSKVADAERARLGSLVGHVYGSLLGSLYFSMGLGALIGLVKNPQSLEHSMSSDFERGVFAFVLCLGTLLFLWSVWNATLLIRSRVSPFTWMGWVAIIVDAVITVAVTVFAGGPVGLKRALE